MRNSGILALLFTLLISQTIDAQSLGPGQRIRVTFADDPPPYIGRVDSIHPGHLWVSGKGVPSRSLEVGSVSGIERSDGRKPSVLKGLLLGGLGGAVIGGILYATTADVYMKDDGDVWLPIFLGAGIGGGALLGGGLTLVVARERWSVVPREQWAKAGARWKVGLINRK